MPIMFDLYIFASSCDNWKSELDGNETRWNLWFGWCSHFLSRRLQSVARQKCKACARARAHVFPQFLSPNTNEQMVSGAIESH